MGKRVVTSVAVIVLVVAGSGCLSGVGDTQSASSCIFSVEKQPTTDQFDLAWAVERNGEFQTYINSNKSNVRVHASVNGSVIHERGLVEGENEIAINTSVLSEASMIEYEFTDSSERIDSARILVRGCGADS